MLYYKHMIQTNDMSSSGCINLIVIPDVDSGFFIVGGADTEAGTGGLLMEGATDAGTGGCE